MKPTDLSQRLDEIEKRASASTKGPWQVEVDDDTLETRIISGLRELAQDVCEKSAPFIASARTDVPMLLKMPRLAIDQRSACAVGG